MSHFRLLTLLPSLPSAPEAPPEPLDFVAAQILEALAPPYQRLARALLAELDCRNAEALLLGLEPLEHRAQIPVEHLQACHSLPRWLETVLRAAQNPTQRPSTETLWTAWLQHLLDLRDVSESAFFSAWVTFEASLRDDLAHLRERQLHVPQHASRERVRIFGRPTHTDLLHAVQDAPDPREQERRIDSARLDHIRAIEGTDPFSADAALAYLASMLILDRWSIPDSVDIDGLLETFHP